MKIAFKNSKRAAAVVVLCLLAGPVSATVYSFQEGVWNGTDGSATGYNVDDGFTGFFDVDAIRDDTFLGVQRNVSSAIVSNFRFDLTAAAAELQPLDQATLTLHVDAVSGSGGLDSPMKVYALPVGNTQWIETTASFSEQDEVTVGDDPWKLSNGSDVNNNYTAATDGVLIASIPFSSAAPSVGDDVVFDLDTTTVTQWLSNPSGYAGFSIIMDSTIGFSRVNFASSESTTSANRPQLDLVFVVPEPSTGIMFIVGSLLSLIVAGRRFRA